MEQTLYSAILEQLIQLSHDRRARTVLMQGTLPSMMWGVVLLGGLLVTIGIYYLNISHTHVQTVIDILVVGMQLSLVYVAVELNGPFDGDLKVSPKAFKLLDERLLELRR